jgi:hypothetical protein
MRVLLANLAWFLSTLPDALRFWLALGDPAKAQARAAARRRPTRPEDVILEEPTSGTTGGTKWIPYTEQLRREFMRAVNPWMASVYLRHPGLLLRTHYWSVSPYTEVRQPENGRRRGFAEDREYLGPVRARLTRALFPVSAAVAEERDPERHLLRTARALVASRQLGLISVWHPSAFLRLLGFMASHPREITDDERLRASAAARRFCEIWPHLRLISCWDAAFAEADAQALRKLFPGVEVEGKGLLATEGVVTIPWFGRRVAAITSHNLSFEAVDDASGEPIPGTAVGVERLEVGKRYGVVLTTGNGFTGYRLGDVVECVGFERRSPRLEFRYRAGGIVDLHGEKMHPAFAAEVMKKLAARFARPRFAVLAPRVDRCGYRLFWEPDGGLLPDASSVEELLRANYHYAHAVNLRQLAPVEVVEIHDGLGLWCRATHGMPASAKPPTLTAIPLDGSGADCAAPPA